MTVALILLLGCLSVFGLVVLARWLDALDWRRSLVAYQLFVPRGLTADDVARWLALVNGATHAHPLALLPAPPVALEVVGTARGIGHYLLVPKSMGGVLLSNLRAALPGARLEEAPDYLTNRRAVRWAAEAGVTSHRRPLRTDLADMASVALLASLQPLTGTEQVVVQWLITGGGIPRVVSSVSSANRQSAGWWFDGNVSVDSEAVRAERVKQQAPLLRTAVRVGISCPTKARQYAVYGRVWAALRTLNASGIGLVRRWWLPPSMVAGRMARLVLPITTWPLTLNAGELAGLLGLSTGDSHLPGVVAGTSRQLPPSPAMPTRGSVVGVSNYPGLANRPLALKTSDRLRHAFLLGPTGSGKSWELARLILQDIDANRGVVVIDPKGDLVTDVLARIDPRHDERIVVLDASKRNQPIGFNVLADNTSEEARELTVEAVLHVFKEIWSSFWGPRSDQIMRAALSTLVNARAVDGSALTLCELVPLLTQPSFRRFVVRQPTVPEAARAFWRLFESWGDGGATQAINPVVNKVEAFTGRTPIRLMLGQSHGFDFEAVFRERKVVLISLAKGTLGDELANLLGALLVSSLWETTRARVRIPAEQRHPVFAYIDEAADIMRLPLALSEMLAQARGLGLGVIAATQFIAQVPEAVKAAFLGTVRTQLTFAVEHDDAVVLAKRFAPLSVDDLKGLGSFEFALRPCLNGTTVTPVTGKALPLGDPIRPADDLAAASRTRYGVPRADVEAALRARVAVPATANGPIGREPNRRTT